MVLNNFIPKKRVHWGTVNTLLSLLLITAMAALMLFIIPGKVDAAISGPDLPHMTDFLTLPNGPGGTTWYPMASSANRTTCRQTIINKGYTHLYLSVTSSSHNYYGNPNGFKVFLQELVDAGIKPVVWLTSDTGTWKDQSISTIKSDLTAFIPQIDSLVSSYCMGIEIEEYWSKSEADEIGAHLNTLTSKPIGVHQLPGAWNFATSNYCDYMILQYGFGKNTSEIATITTNCINSLGKPVVAGEYNIDGGEALSITLGNAAVAAGASGFGNGGTPYTPGPTPTPTPTPIPGELITNLVVNDSTNAADWSIRANIQSGDTMYGDRTFSFTSMPSSVAGCDWIRTANDSKAYTGATLVTFTVNADADVYVAHNDLITSKPSWLQSGWTDTGEDIVNNEATPKTFSLYKKSYTSGSQVSLGQNGSTSSGMYTIIVKATGGGPTPTPTPTPTNVPPVASNSNETAVTGVEKYIQLSMTDSDGPGPYTYSILSGPSHGTLTGSSNDRYYTSNAGYIGSDSFTWRVNDGLANSNTATVNITISSGSTLLNEDFNDGVANNWTVQSGTWSVNSGLYKETATSGRQISYYANGGSWNNYTYSASVKKANKVGITFRHSNGNADCYNLRWTGSSTVEFAKLVSGVYTVLQTYSYAATTGTFYTMKVVANGSNFTFYINSTQLGTTSDTTLSDGSVGLYTFDCASDFDNVLVTN